LASAGLARLDLIVVVSALCADFKPQARLLKSCDYSNLPFVFLWHKFDLFVGLVGFSNWTWSRRLFVRRF